MTCSGLFRGPMLLPDRFGRLSKFVSLLQHFSEDRSDLASFRRNRPRLSISPLIAWAAIRPNRARSGTRPEIEAGGARFGAKWRKSGRRPPDSHAQRVWRPPGCQAPWWSQRAIVPLAPGQERQKPRRAAAEIHQPAPQEAAARWH